VEAGGESVAVAAVAQDKHNKAAAVITRFFRIPFLPSAVEKMPNRAEQGFFFENIPANLLQLMGGDKKNQVNIRREKRKKTF
jgi:hypothetical protein